MERVSNRVLALRSFEPVEVAGLTIILEYGNERSLGCCSLNYRFLAND
jgi:hypothetical protein